MKFTTPLAMLGIAIVSLASATAATFGSFSYTDNGTTITIDSYSHWGPRKVEIPAEIVGKPVVEIAPNAFGNTRFITGITFPNTIRRIGARAFAQTSVSEMRIPEGVTTIEEGVFEECFFLKSVSLPASVVKIGDRAFARCRWLETSVPTATVSIGNEAFRDCARLTNSTLPSTLRSIGDRAFSSTSITSIKIPDSVVSIGVGAFSDCTKLRSATLPRGLKSIPDDLFTGNRALSSVELPEAFVSIGQRSFYNTAIKKVRFPEGLKRIGPSAFEQCRGITTVAFPKSIRFIGDNAFTTSGSSSTRSLLGVSFKGKAPVLGKKAFGVSSPHFRVYVGEKAKGFTRPRWNGYRVSAPAPEIAVMREGDISLIKSGSGVVYVMGNALVGKKGEKLTFTIINGGSKKLENIQAVIRGGSTDFVLTNLGKTTLKPGARTTVTVRFRPTKMGARTARLRILSNDADEPAFDINLRGRGIVPFR